MKRQKIDNKKLEMINRKVACLRADTHRQAKSAEGTTVES